MNNIVSTTQSVMTAFEQTSGAPWTEWQMDIWPFDKAPPQLQDLADLKNSEPDWIVLVSPKMQEKFNRDGQLPIWLKMTDIFQSPKGYNIENGRVVYIGCKRYKKV